MSKESKVLEQAVRQIVNERVDLLQSTKHLIWRSFLRGIFIGLGSVIGATVMVAILIFVLTALGGIPGIGELFENLRETIEQRQPQSQ